MNREITAPGSKEGNTSVNSKNVNFQQIARKNSNLIWLFIETNKFGALFALGESHAQLHSVQTHFMPIYEVILGEKSMSRKW